MDEQRWCCQTGVSREVTTIQRNCAASNGECDTCVDEWCPLDEDKYE